MASDTVWQLRRFAPGIGWQYWSVDEKRGVKKGGTRFTDRRVIEETRAMLHPGWKVVRLLPKGGAE